MQKLRNVSQGLYDLSTMMNQYLVIREQFVTANRLLDEDDPAMNYFTKRLEFLRQEMVNLATDEVPGSPSSQKANVPPLTHKSERTQGNSFPSENPQPRESRPHRLQTVKGGVPKRY